METDLWELYSLMLKSRLIEEAIAQLWREGLISGEMHLGTGEEAIYAGVVSHLRDGDAMALDHRGTGPLLVRGVDPAPILKELLGRADGLCGGKGGHMHLYSKKHLAASSGIVGASGPAAVGFALSGSRLRPGSIAVAFFGEGAINQGMLMESMNLAVVWKLPVFFVCKDDSWSITTKSEEMTGADVTARASGFGLNVSEADGTDVAGVYRAAGDIVARMRNGGEPEFLRVGCVHLEGHFLGYRLIRATKQPLREMPGIALPLTRSLFAGKGAGVRERVAGLKMVVTSLLDTIRDPRNDSKSDPVANVRRSLLGDEARLIELEQSIGVEVTSIVTKVTERELEEATKEGEN
jgi:pyruvate dehydrogenase E1 component alpha subunit